VKKRLIATAGAAVALAMLVPSVAYASTSTSSQQTLAVQAGTLFVSNTTPANITAQVGGTGSGALPSAEWGDLTGTGDGWQGSIAASDFIYTGNWSPVGSAPALSSDASAGYTGTADGDTYTVTITSVSGTTINFSYSSTNGASGTGSATVGTAADVGAHGLTITFSTSATYAAGDAYQIEVGAQNPDALVLANTQNPSISPVSAQSYSDPPLFVNPQAAIQGSPAGYGPAVPLLSAGTEAGMGDFNVSPQAVVNTDINSWAQTYTAQVEYTISSGPYADGASDATNSTEPVISSVQEANTGQNATFIITGSGFGTLPSSDLGYNTTSDFALNYNYNNDGFVQAGHTTNALTMDYKLWTNNEIIVSGFNNAYYTNLDWSIKPSSQYELIVDNPQSGSSTDYFGMFPSQITAPTGAPTISNVTVTNYGASGMTITVTGDGFGSQPNTLPYTGDEQYFGLANTNGTQLGNTGDGDPLTYTEWTNNTIQVQVSSSYLSAFGSGITTTVVVANANGDALPVQFTGNGSFS
jgi:hypothetical protein